MKIKIFIFTLIIFLMAAVPSYAKQLPKEIKDFLQTQKKVPTVRFDGIVVYNDNVMYIPVFPAYPEEVEKVEVVRTYPENQSIDKLPDLILFNNNFSLLKIIRTGANTHTI